jgi:hypothetical protein
MDKIEDGDLVRYVDPYDSNFVVQGYAQILLGRTHVGLCYRSHGVNVCMFTRPIEDVVLIRKRKEIENA